ncbi:MAG: hypothetical protein EGR48_04985 [Lachnospiraceae bacterium]|nr:hypothetical protein [Lachnospiraceae bacterium]
MKEKKRMRKGRTIVAFLLALLFAVSAPAQEVRAEEYNENTTHTFIVASETQEYDSFGVQPVTTLVNCQIIMAFSADEGLVMTFTTSCVGLAKVIGVKDIKVQQKMWYGWKTVLVSDGAESVDRASFGANLTYADAIKDKTYRVICTHYADYDGYEESVNDTGAFKFTY